MRAEFIEWWQGSNRPFSKLLQEIGDTGVTVIISNDNGGNKPWSCILFLRLPRRWHIILADTTGTSYGEVVLEALQQYCDYGLRDITKEREKP